MGRRKERKRSGKTYATVSAVSAAALLRCLVHLDMLDDQVSRVKALGVGVCLRVLQETKKKFGGFDGPASAGDAELFS